MSGERYMIVFSGDEVPEGFTNRVTIFLNEIQLKDYIFRILCLRFMTYRWRHVGLQKDTKHPATDLFDRTLNKIFSTLPPINDTEAQEEQIEIALERENRLHISYSLQFFLGVLKSIFQGEGEVYIIHGKNLEAEIPLPAYTINAEKPN